MRVWAWAVGHPQTAIAVVGLAAVIASAYPVVFAGRSYDSPNMGTGLLYPFFPTVPGSHTTAQEDIRGSDVGAMAWQNGPYAMIQHRAVFDDGEFPLWNRYNDFGTPLLGQGISMIFDPVHWIAVIGNGAAWTWDLKFLIAKTLLAVGLGGLVFAATRFLPAALLVAASSAFLGFFIVRLNHPDFFSFCYAPWVLLAWVRIIQAASTRQRWPWLLALALATMMCLNSGAVKSGLLLCGAMHLAGILALLLDRRPLRERLKLLAVMSLLGVAILLITAPSYLTFFETLKQSVTTYDLPVSVTLAPGAAIGSFEELFGAMMSATHRVQFPTANLLLFLGLAWLLARPSVFRRNRLLVVLAAGAGAAFATAFGFVPETWLSATPFIRNIQHIGYEFTEIFIIFGAVLAGYGIMVFWQRCSEPDWLVDYFVVLAILLFLVGVFVPALTLSGQLLWLDNWNVGLALVALISAALLPLAARFLISGKLVAAPVVVLVILCLLGIHARYGMQLESGVQKLDYYVVNPQERPDFSVPSPAIQSLPDPSTQPFRAVGLGPTMFFGFNAALGIEAVFSPDPLCNPRYKELIDGVGFEQNFSGWATFFTPENLQKHAAALDLLNVRYVLAPHTMGDSVPGVVRTRADLDVVERPTVWPRAFFTDRLLEYRELPEFAGLLQNAKGRPFAAVQNGEAPTTVPTALSAADREARLVVPATAYRLTCNTTTFTVEAPKAGVAVLSEQYYPDVFQVTVNGRSAPYFRVNHAFRGVVLDGPGRYTIGFTYRPKVWSLSLTMFAAGVVLLAALVFWQVRRSRSVVGDTEPSVAGASLDPQVAAPSATFPQKKSPEALKRKRKV
jgi:hypothetical protein